MSTSSMSGAPEQSDTARRVVVPGPASGTADRAVVPVEAPEMSVGAAFAGMRRVAHVVFRAGCPDCRARFELGANALRLAIGATSRTTFYSFTCPECGVPVRKPAGERIVALLTGGGVRTLRLHSTV
ncbi:hypothetical protein Save01_04821 [Streptomyces avermitilis]|uniref:Uncharacterized protein n=4 Tax=Streptomyces TaxID=1883 RepID=Q828H9_STRAW|nr:hypothetical protein SAVERM_6690 [Streptomyces avermitilis MA-4680 = NBRC 14893]GDY66950.1 hypothetical protein SAV14893_063430 [Streptomyces avermitilis]GDY81914.1 hypothetical protein SAVCW2_11130 [Streptomyces avermitilis]